MSTFLFFLPGVLGFAVVAVYAERKISAFIQDRLGPMEVGRYGLAQTVADMLKLIQKEDVIPAAADRVLFRIAPIIIFTAVFAGYAILPLTSGLQGSTAEVGLFFLLAIVSLDVIGILMSGWGSNNKYALYGALRSVAQLISYEIPLGLSVLCVILISQSLDLQVISFQQGIWASTVSDNPIYLFGIADWNIRVDHIGGFICWNIVQAPFLFFVFIIFFISSLAESNRTPFDLPEAESELIGGYHTEYSGFRWALFMLSEYAMMLLVSFLGSILFLGSWNTPLPNLGSVPLAEWTSGEPGQWSGHLWSVFWLLSKTMFLIGVQMWIRWTYPRLRVDQLMALCWKYLIPLSLMLVIISAVWRLWML